MLPKVVWAEKYRPMSVGDCVFPNHLRDTFEGMVASKEKIFPNMLFYGGPGVGKTTVAKALCEEMDHEWMIINGSKDSGIDTLRTTIQNFASSVSLDSHRKCILLDEADRMNGVLQDGLRGSMEEFSSNCAFIFTCNYKYKIIREIHSRCAVFDFSIDPSERKEIKKGIYRSIVNILEMEKVPFEKEVVAAHLNRFFPDFRRTINELQAYAISRKKIDNGILSQKVSAQEDLLEVTKLLRTKDFNKIFEWCMTVDYDPSVYDDLWKMWVYDKKMEASSLSEATCIASEFEDRSTRAVNPRLNLCAFLSHIMTSCKFV